MTLLELFSEIIQEKKMTESKLKQLLAKVTNWDEITIIILLLRLIEIFLKPSEKYVKVELLEEKGKKVLKVLIKSPIFVFLTAEEAFCKINMIAKATKLDINRIVVTTPEGIDDQSKTPVRLCWTVNPNEKRNKKIHERNFVHFLKYLWFRAYIPNWLGKQSKEQAKVLDRVFWDQSIQEKYIKEVLKKLEDAGYFGNSKETVESIYEKILREWIRRFSHKGLGHIIMYRWQAIDIGTELGLLKDDRYRKAVIFNGFQRLPVDFIIAFFEEVEKLAKGSLVVKNRKLNIVYQRECLMYIIRKSTPYSYARIGKGLGDRNHSTILHGFKKVERRLEKSSVQKALLEQYCILFDNIRISKAEGLRRKINK